MPLLQHEVQELITAAETEESVAHVRGNCSLLKLRNTLVKLLVPSDSYRLGGAVAGDDGDEARVVCVLQREDKHTFTHAHQHLFVCEK